MLILKDITVQCVVKPVILAIEPSDVNVSILVFFFVSLYQMYSQWEKLLTMLREMDEDTAVDSEEKKKKAENKLMAEDGEELTAVNIEP